jgi:hypothetical protein
MFEKKVLSRMFGPKKEEITKNWRKVHKEELYHLFSSPNTDCIKKDGEMGGTLGFFVD